MIPFLMGIGSSNCQASKEQWQRQTRRMTRYARKWLTEWGMSKVASFLAIEVLANICRNAGTMSSWLNWTTAGNTSESVEGNFLRLVLNATQRVWN